MGGRPEHDNNRSPQGWSLLTASPFSSLATTWFGANTRSNTRRLLERSTPQLICLFHHFSGQVRVLVNAAPLLALWTSPSCSAHGGTGLFQPRSSPPSCPPPHPSSPWQTTLASSTPPPQHQERGESFLEYCQSRNEITTQCQQMKVGPATF